jgi:hypothetical protein
MTVKASDLCFFNFNPNSFNRKTITNHIRDVTALLPSHMVKGQNYCVAFPTIYTMMFR